MSDLTTEKASEMAKLKSRFARRGIGATSSVLMAAENLFRYAEKAEAAGNLKLATQCMKEFRELMQVQADKRRVNTKPEKPTKAAKPSAHKTARDLLLARQKAASTESVPTMPAALPGGLNGHRDINQPA